MEATNHTPKQKSFDKCYAKRLKQDPSTSTSLQSDIISNIGSESLMPQNDDNNAVALDFKQSGDSSRHTIAKTKTNNLRISLEIQRLRFRGLSQTLMSLSKECEKMDQENNSIEKDIVRTIGENASSI